jgi:hypothetical protein
MFALLFFFFALPFDDAGVDTNLNEAKDASTPKEEHEEEEEQDDLPRRFLTDYFQLGVSVSALCDGWRRMDANFASRAAGNRIRGLR